MQLFGSTKYAKVIKQFVNKRKCDQNIYTLSYTTKINLLNTYTYINTNWET